MTINSLGRYIARVPDFSDEDCVVHVTFGSEAWSAIYIGSCIVCSWCGEKTAHLQAMETRTF